jgi:hypothetical protein
MVNGLLTRPAPIAETSAMKPIALPPSPPGSDPAAQFAWIKACLQAIERASQEEPAQIFDSYSPDTTQKPAAVLATVIVVPGVAG